MSHPIENMMRVTLEQLKAISDVNTIVGEPVMTTAATMVMPVSKVSMGFVTGGGEYECAGQCKDTKKPVKASGDEMDANEGKLPFAGVSAAGVCLKPVAFLSVCEGNVKLMPVEYRDGFDRAMDMMPELMRELIGCCKGDGKKGAGECARQQD